MLLDTGIFSGFCVVHSYTFRNFLIQIYRVVIMRKTNFLNARTLKKEVTLEEGFEKFIHHKIAMSKAEETINNNLRSVRCTLYYFMEKGYMGYFKVQLTKAKKKPKDGYTQEEQEKLLKKPDVKRCTFSEYRNWVIICHLLASGNRSRTIRGIKNKDVDLKSRVILLTEVKNDEIYEMPITSEYYPILCEYMEIRKGEPDDYLFCNQYGSQLTAGGLRSVMRKYNLNHGVTTA